MTHVIRTLSCALVLATSLAGGASALDPRPGVKLRALDKITGVAQELDLKINETQQFLGMTLTLRACYQSAPEALPPESAAYLEIDTDRSLKIETKDGKPAPAFEGWMFASSPGLNALEDPVYDVWVSSCMAAPPESE